MSRVYKVFYFEDDDSAAQPIKSFLKSPVQGKMEVDYHTNVNDAKEAINSDTTPPDVALLDRHQDGYANAGIDICKMIKNKWPSTPVVFLSDYAGIRDQIGAADAQADVYLSKAMRSEPDHKELIQKVLLAQIRNVLGVMTPTPGCETGSLKVSVDIPGVWWRDQKLSLSPDNIAIVHELATPQRKGKPRAYNTLAIAGDLRGDDDHLKDNVKKHIQHIRNAFREVDEDFPQACKDKRHGIIAVPTKGYYWKSDVPDVVQ